MNDKDQYELGEAIRRFHGTPPLNIDLATIVAGKIFRQQRIKTFVPDKWLYASIAVLVLAGIVLSVGRLSLPSLPAIMLIVLLAAAFALLSAKEYSAMAKRLSM